jgi:hypothetical protein
MDLYIYYRASISVAEEVKTRVSAMQVELTKRWGISASLKRRPESKNEQDTWMEVYLSVPQNFEAALASAVTLAKLDDLIDGPRHTEYFLDVFSCA